MSIHEPARRLLLTAALIAAIAVFGACSKSSEKPPEATSSTESTGTSAPASAPAAAWYESTDIVGIKLGMGAEEAVQHLADEGWERMKEQRKIANVPGIEPIEYPGLYHYQRLVERDGHWDHEVLGLHFLAPVPGESAPIYIVTFDRQTHAKPDFRNRITDAAIVTPEYTTSMLAAIKSKYGEPNQLDEGACTSRGGVVESIPIYELHYYPEARAYGGAGLQVKIGETCRQSFSVRMEDANFSRSVRNRFDAFAKEQLEKASAAGTGKVDF